MVLIRPESDEDIPFIHAVVLTAFQSPLEPMLVDRLREEEAA
jgi:predicted N-acetyltransferase YhbS